MKTIVFLIFAAALGFAQTPAKPVPAAPSEVTLVVDGTDGAEKWVLTPEVIYVFNVLTKDFDGSFASRFITFCQNTSTQLRSREEFAPPSDRADINAVKTAELARQQKIKQSLGTREVDQAKKAKIDQAAAAVSESQVEVKK